MKTNRRILGVDPGLARLGWAIVETGPHRSTLVGCGCLETPAGEKIERRLHKLHQRLGDIVREYTPHELAVETLFFSKNVSTAMAVGQARGIVLLAAAEHRLAVSEFTPTAVKSSVTGDGRADKRQMGRMIKLLLGLHRLPKHDDTTDAIAIALCGASMNVIH